jgi:hypothetical protein
MWGFVTVQAGVGVALHFFGSLHGLFVGGAAVRELATQAERTRRTRPFLLTLTGMFFYGTLTGIFIGENLSLTGM